MRISDWSSDVCSSDLNGKLPGSCGIYRNGRGNYRLGDLPNLAQQCSQGLILRPVDAGKLQCLSYLCCPLAVHKVDVCLLAQRPNNAQMVVSFAAAKWLFGLFRACYQLFNVRSSYATQLQHHRGLSKKECA